MTMKCKKFLVAIFTFLFIFTGIFSFGVEAKASADGILGKLPDNYIDPPNISYSFEFEESENLLVSTNALTRLNRGNYKWNKNESFDNDYYLIKSELWLRN